MSTKLELNKTYYQLNKEKLKEKRKQRYLLNKNNSEQNGKSEQSLDNFNKLSEHCSVNKSSLNIFNQSEQFEQKEIVQSKISEQLEIGLNKTEPILNKILKTEQTLNVQTNLTEQNVLSCLNCPELEKQLKDTEKTLDLIDNQKKEYFKQLEKELQQIDKLTNEKQAISSLYDRLKIDFNNKVKSLLEIDEENEKLNQKIKELENPINPTIELWKGRYSSLEKEFGEKGTEQAETIKRLKEKLRELFTKNQELEKHKEVKNSSQNQVSIPKEADVIPILLDKKHKKLIFYSCPSPCYEGKSCNNCSFFTQSTIKYEHIQ